MWCNLVFSLCFKVAGHPFVHVDSSELAGYLSACMRSCDIRSPVQSDLMFRAEQSKQRKYEVDMVHVCCSFVDVLLCVHITSITCTPGKQVVQYIRQSSYTLMMCRLCWTVTISLWTGTTHNTSDSLLCLLTNYFYSSSEVISNY